jgi:hypothetical protein
MILRALIDGCLLDSPALLELPAPEATLSCHESANGGNDLLGLLSNLSRWQIGA